MPKTTLTENEYLAELNRRLREHSSFQPGMKFIPAPPGARGPGMHGYSFVEDGLPHWVIGVYAEVGAGVSEDFELKL